MGDVAISPRLLNQTMALPVPTTKVVDISSSNAFASHSVTWVSTPELTSRIASSYDGIYQGSKFIRALSLISQLTYGSAAVVAKTVGGAMKEVADFTQMVGLFNRVNVFASGDNVKKNYSFSKNVYCVCLVIKGVLDSLKWLAAHSVLSLAKAAAAISRVPVLGFAAKFSLGTLSDAFCIIGCIFDIVDCAMKIAKTKGKPHTREWLAIANDVGKIACCALSFMFFSYTFAAVSLFTASTALLKVGMDKVADMKRENAEKAAKEFAEAAALQKAVDVIKSSASAPVPVPLSGITIAA
jgi:hypothetical protein